MTWEELHGLSAKITVLHQIASPRAPPNFYPKLTIFDSNIDSNDTR